MIETIENVLKSNKLKYSLFGITIVLISLIVVTSGWSSLGWVILTLFFSFFVSALSIVDFFVNDGWYKELVFYLPNWIFTLIFGLSTIRNMTEGVTL